MTNFHLYYNVSDRFFRDQLLIITYPTPPYQLLRELIGPRPVTPIVRRWLLIGSGSGYGSGKLVTTTSSQTEKTGNKTYVRFRRQNVSIQDRVNKALVYDTTMKKLFATPLGGENINHKAMFEITFYFTKDGDKKAVTLKIKDTNLYLSISQNHELILQENAKLQEKEIEIDDFTKQFFFFSKEDTHNYFTFESVMYAQFCISTKDKDGEPVTITGPNTKSSIQKVYVEFLMKNETSGVQGEKTTSTTSGISDPYDRFCLQDSMNYAVKM